MHLADDSFAANTRAILCLFRSQNGKPPPCTFHHLLLRLDASSMPGPMLDRRHVFPCWWQPFRSSAQQASMRSCSSRGERPMILHQGNSSAASERGRSIEPQ
ncbi:hypothetical protein DPSP01_006459 [Paraphaeosphaeria sporulosa]